MSAVVAQVDHVFFEVADPAALVAVFTERLGLPVAWPYGEHGPFASGGVVFGNANVEFVRWTSSPGSTRATAPRPVRGIAFQPTGLEPALEELRRRGIAPDRIAPFERTTPDGAKVLLWTNVMLTGHFGYDGGSMIFLCQYTRDMTKQRVDRRAELERREGGALGVRRISELVVGVRDLDESRRAWAALLAPAEPTGDTWSLGDGPAIRLSPAAVDGLIGFEIVVRDVEAARRALAGVALQGVELRLHA